jgi:hypothetical protein
MPSELDPITIEQVLQGSASDIIIAQPGEPIVNTTPLIARQKANRYVGGEITMMMGGREPALVYSGGRLVWRVPIVFTSPFRGQLGVVGALDVDAHTGVLQIPPNFEKSVTEKAYAILKDSPYSAEI